MTLAFCSLVIGIASPKKISPQKNQIQERRICDSPDLVSNFGFGFASINTMFALSSKNVYIKN